MSFEDEVGSILRHNVAPYTHDFNEVTDDMMKAAIVKAHRRALVRELTLWADDAETVFEDTLYLSAMRKRIAQLNGDNEHE